MGARRQPDTMGDDKKQARERTRRERREIFFGFAALGVALLVFGGWQLALAVCGVVYAFFLLVALFDIADAIRWG